MIMFKNKAVGKHQCALLKFAEKYCVNRWHCYANDRTTKRAVAGGVKRGWLKINEHNQFSLVLPN